MKGLFEVLVNKSVMYNFKMCHFENEIYIKDSKLNLKEFQILQMILIN